MTKSKQPPAPVTQNACAARGHVEIRLGANTFQCGQCLLMRPKGGWSHECAKLAKPRAWMGG